MYVNLLFMDTVFFVRFVCAGRTITFMSSVKHHYHTSKVRYNIICPRGSEDDNGVLHSTKNHPSV